MAQLEPRSHRPLSNREKIILLRGAKHLGLKFVEWDTSTIKSEHDRPIDTPFVDDFQYSLSFSQQGRVQSWQALWPPNDSFNSPTMRCNKLDIRNIAQGPVPDCSVVASIIAIIALAYRGHINLLESICHPFDAENGCPSYSELGRYLFRFFFNGAYRKVIVDGRLPKDYHGRALHIHERRNASLSWPGLIEKAFLKLSGGYDFPGSDSASDLWTMTGWIPEVLHLQRQKTEIRLLWPAIRSSWVRGKIMMTLGTGESRLNAALMDDPPLLEHHEYVVLDMLDTNNGMRLRLLDSDRGHDSYDHAQDPGEASGSFEIDLGEQGQHFKFLHMVWDPCLFMYREDIHFCWKIETMSSFKTLIDNPQFVIDGASGAQVWLLLGRHRYADQDRRVGLGRYRRPEFANIGLISCTDDGNHLLSYPKDGMRSRSNNANHALLKLDMSGAQRIAIIQEAQPAAQHAFTLSAFSNDKIRLNPAYLQYSYRILHENHWSNETAGGNSNEVSYTLNPQFALLVSEATDIAILLDCVEASFAVNLKLFWSRTRLTQKPLSKDIFMDSGDYSKSTAVIKANRVPAGTYTLICSTFSPGQTSDLTLTICSSSECILKQQPSLGVGRFKSELRTSIETWGCAFKEVFVQTRCLNKMTVLIEFDVIQDTNSSALLFASIAHGPRDNPVTIDRHDRACSSSKISPLLFEDVEISSTLCDQDLRIIIGSEAASDLMVSHAIKLSVYSEEPLALGL